jgi:hypothetical protein
MSKVTEDFQAAFKAVGVGFKDPSAVKYVGKSKPVTEGFRLAWEAQKLLTEGAPKKDIPPEEWEPGMFKNPPRINKMDAGNKNYLETAISCLQSKFPETANLKWHFSGDSWIADGKAILRGRLQVFFKSLELRVEVVGPPPVLYVTANVVDKNRMRLSYKICAIPLTQSPDKAPTPPSRW